jgi:hypothetical protein
MVRRRLIFAVRCLISLINFQQRDYVAGIDNRRPFTYLALFSAESL